MADDNGELARLLAGAEQPVGPAERELAARNRKLRQQGGQPGDDLATLLASTGGIGSDARMPVAPATDDLTRTLAGTGGGIGSDARMPLRDPHMQRKIQAWTMAGREPTPDMMAYLAANAPEKEARSEALSSVAPVAASLMAPVGPAAQLVGRGIQAAPKLVAALAGTAGLTAGGSEAANEAAPKDYQPPGLLHEIWDALPGASTEDQRPLSREEYIAKRGRPAARSKDEFMTSEVDKIRDSDRYREAGPKLRSTLENEAHRSAEALYKSYSESQTEAAGKLNTDYEDYKRGWGTQRTEHLNKQFSERHPWANAAMTVGGPLLSALATRGIFGKINHMGDDIANAGKLARSTDDTRALADSIVKADKYAKFAPAAKAATVTEAALIPAEMRMAGDIVDKKGLPPDSGARKAAETRMGDFAEYGKGMGYDVFSGAVGAAGGGLWAKARTPSPSVDLSALRNHAAGIDRGGFPEMLRGPRMSQDQLAEILADRSTNAITAQQHLNAARQGAPSGLARSGGAPSSAPGHGTPNQSTAPMEGELIPPRSSLADRVRAPSPLSEPVVDQSGQLARLLAEGQQPGLSSLANSDDLLRALRQPRQPLPEPPRIPPLPSGMRYRSDGVVINAHTGHPIKKELLTGREAPARKRGSKSAEPDKEDVQIDDMRPLRYPEE